MLTGLNYFKNQTDPVALPDDAYPTWLWKCLEVQKKADEGADEDAGDEFCKSPQLIPTLSSPYFCSTLSYTPKPGVINPHN